MPNAQPSLGELEFAVLKALWERQPATVQEVAEALDKNYARTTILTVIQRLYAKGFLSRRKEQGIFRYWTKQDRRSTVSGLVRRFMSAFLDDSPVPLVAYLAESKQLTAEQAAELRRIVDEWDSRTKE